MLMPAIRAMVVFPKTLCSALALLVTRIGADHADHALAADDLAVAADLLDGSRNSHSFSPKFPIRAWLQRKSIRARDESQGVNSNQPQPPSDVLKFAFF